MINKTLFTFMAFRI